MRARGRDIQKLLVTKARFRFRADLEDRDLACHKNLPRAKVKELAELTILHNQEILLIVGKTDLGKRLCQAGHTELFLPVNFLFEVIQAAKTAGRSIDYLHSLIKAKVLILDELGLRPYSHKRPLL
jgi:DNA replication protein DnaC